MVRSRFLVLVYTLLFLAVMASSVSSSSDRLKRGSSLSVEDRDPLHLVSPDGTFACGFHGLGGNAFWFSVWFVSSGDTASAVVWTANRDRPVNGRGSRLAFRGDGILALTDADGSSVWATNTTSTNAQWLEILDSGNLVLKDPLGTILWQSFDYPTDTLLPGQPLTKNIKLLSSLESGGYSSGYYSFFFDSDNVLKMLYDGPDISSLYWPDPDLTIFQNGRSNYNSSRIAVLDGSGHFLSSDQFQFNSSDRGPGISRRLTINHDGNLRLYSLNKSTGTWSVTWLAVPQHCKVHGICGQNGICLYTPEPKCTCPPGYEISDPDDWNKGCKPTISMNCSKIHPVKFVQLPFTDYHGFDLIYSPNASFNSCRQLCLDDCNCRGFTYRLNGERTCFGKSLLFNGYNQPNFQGSFYLKLPVSTASSAIVVLRSKNTSCRNGGNLVSIGSPSMYDSVGSKTKWVYLYSFATAIGTIEAFVVLMAWLISFKRDGLPMVLEEGYRVLSGQFRKFSYKELKIATQNFKDKVGSGGSGSVYKGTLPDDRVVAVKRLGNMYHGDEVFWAEVSMIGRINHINLVRMWGFCCEGRNRLLVYEFMEKESLDKHLFSGNPLDWKTRFKVALGTAKGLAYLHHECLEWVIHCDIKPENILLDTDFEPKISDFGLAKLLQRDRANPEFTQIRGTKGYMAPEWALNLPITAKVDVYSYGVMVLEMVRGVRLSSWVRGKDEEGEDQEMELVKFVREMKRRMEKGEEVCTEDVVDERLQGEYERNQAARMIQVGVACVEEDRHKRPSMDSAVDILLGSCDGSILKPQPDVANSGIVEIPAIG
ncbi:hypothetical protein MLD38_032621 [Melastoma candidum]|uniref:Uncharacterized protein n=1 Tax=Melastoma candidum TaxID=119954 RepID=A0ACB9M6M0_9MYRT|nr:hypothetical protein MLD38_032621 [Melastoma candidum]